MRTARLLSQVRNRTEDENDRQWLESVCSQFSSGRTGKINMARLRKLKNKSSVVAAVRRSAVDVAWKLYALHVDDVVGAKIKGLASSALLIVEENDEVDDEATKKAFLNKFKDTIDLEMAAFAFDKDSNAKRLAVTSPVHRKPHVS